MMSKYDINCLRYIVLNICNMCNCRCRICPQSLEPYRENHKNEIMDVDTAWILKKRLDGINYKGIVSISGMGEPTLNIYLKEILKILSKNREYKLWIVTNGLRLLGEDKYILNVLLEYCDRIDISIHDMDKYYNDFKELQKSKLTKPVVIPSTINMQNIKKSYKNVEKEQVEKSFVNQNKAAFGRL